MDWISLLGKVIISLFDILKKFKYLVIMTVVNYIILSIIFLFEEKKDGKIYSLIIKHQLTYDHEISIREEMLVFRNWKRKKYIELVSLVQPLLFIGQPIIAHLDIH